LLAKRLDYLCFLLSTVCLKHYLDILRPKNLLIVMVSQWLIYRLYMQPLDLGAGLVLEKSLWWLFVLDTVLIAASGYVINDIFDLVSDKVNKPNGVYISDSKISLKNAWVYYIGLVLLGFLIAAYIASEINKIHLLIIYPLAVGLLFMYSYSWKKLPYIGNIVVAIFCAFVPGIILYAEWDRILLLQDLRPTVFYNLISVFIAYISFAFFTTLAREIIKDIEDVEGDRLAGYKTSPVFYGEKNSQRASIVSMVLLIASFWFWTFPTIERHYLFLLIPLVVFLMIPAGYLLFLLMRAKHKKEFTYLSKCLKYLMIVSLFFFLYISILM